MPKIFQTVKRIIAGGGSAFIASVVNVGIKLTNVITITLSELVKPGVKIEQSPTTLQGVSHTAKPGFLMSLIGATGSSRADSSPAFQMATVMTANGAPPEIPAFVSKLSSLTLTKRAGGNSVTETAVNARTDWASDANAISGTDGLHDGSVASFVGNATGARGGQLELSYADHLSKEKLRITQAKLYFYGVVAATTLNNADVQLRWAANGTTFATLETITGNATFNVTPKVYDITATFDSWVGYNALKTAARCDAAIAETWNVTLDAVEIEILAEYRYVEDASGNLRDGAVLGRVLPTVVALTGYGNAIAFDGVARGDASQGILLGADNAFGLRGNSVFCLDMVFKANAFASFKYLAARSLGAIYDWLFYIGGNDGTNMELRFQYLSNTDTDVIMVSTPASYFPINSIVKTRVTYDGTTIRMYVNDMVTPVASSTVARKAAAATNWTYIGRGVASAPAPYQCDVGMVRFSDVIRTDDLSGPFVTDANTIALYQCEAILP